MRAQTTDSMKPGYWVARVVSRAMMRFYFRCHVTGAEHVPEHGPVLLASNHQSFADSPAIGAALRRPVVFLAGDWLFHKRLTRPIMKAVGAKTAGATGTGLKGVLTALRDGAVIAIFVEGTRTFDGTLQAPLPGVGLLALSGDAAVIPVWIEGLFRLWGRDHRFPRPGRISVSFGAPLDLSDLRAKSSLGKVERRAAQEAATQRVADAIGSLAPNGRPPSG